MNNKSIFNKIISTIFIIWFVGSLLSLYIFKDYVVMIFGQYFLVFGLIAFFNAKKLEKLISLPFIGIGLGCIIIPYLMMHPEVLNISVNWDYVIVISLLSCFVIAGLCMSIIPVIRYKRLKELCNVPVYATITRYKISRNEDTTTYCPVYEFEFNKTKYEVSNNMYRNYGLEEVGSTVEIKINPDNPEQFLDKEKVSKAIVILGIIFLVVIIPVIAYVIIAKPL